MCDPTAACSEIHYGHVGMKECVNPKKKQHSLIVVGESPSFDLSINVGERVGTL
jgi:hypothetical protein